MTGNESFNESGQQQMIVTAPILVTHNCMNAAVAPLEGYSVRCPVDNKYMVEELKRSASFFSSIGWTVEEYTLGGLFMVEFRRPRPVPPSLDPQSIAAAEATEAMEAAEAMEAQAKWEAEAAIAATVQKPARRRIELPRRGHSYSHGSLAPAHIISGIASLLPLRLIRKYEQAMRLGDIDEAASVVVDDCLEYINKRCPEGYYFGMHPGDGSDVGCWSYEEDTRF